MNIIFMGTPDFAVGTLEALLEAGHRINLVVTQPDKPKGRGHAMQYSAVKKRRFHMICRCISRRRSGMRSLSGIWKG